MAIHNLLFRREIAPDPNSIAAKAVVIIFACIVLILSAGFILRYRIKKRKQLERKKLASKYGRNPYHDSELHREHRHRLYGDKSRVRPEENHCMSYKGGMWTYSKSMENRNS